MKSMISARTAACCLSFLCLAIFSGLGMNPAYAGPDCDRKPDHPKCGGGGPGGGTDEVAPDPISDFRTGLATSNTIRLYWTATGDDGNTGTADHYVILQAVQGLPGEACPASFNFDNSTPLTAPSPRAAGGGHEIWAEGLDSETCYAFSIEPFDEAGNSPDPSFTADMTQAPPTAGAWQQETLPGNTYRKLLEFDPGTMQPVVFANDDSTYFFARSSDSTWTSQSVKNNGSGGISFAYNPHPVLGLTFGGGLQSHRNVPSYAELQPDGSWDVTQITRDRVRGNSLAFDADGVATLAFRTVDGRILHLARFNGSSFDIGEPEILNGQGMGWGALLKFDPVSNQPTIVYTSEDQQDILIATYDDYDDSWSVESIHLGNNIGSDIGLFSFEYDPNNQPVIIFRQALDTFWEFWMRMIRRDSSGNWDPADAMTIDPDGLINQNGADLAIADDGTLYVSMVNNAGQVRIGRFCEANQGLSCTPTEDPITGDNTWFWENVAESLGTGGGASIAIDKPNNTVAVVAAEYYWWCDPDSTSVICGSLSAP